MYNLKQSSYRGGSDYHNDRRTEGDNGDYHDDWDQDHQYERGNRGEQYDDSREQYGSRPGGGGGNNRSPKDHKDQMTWQQHEQGGYNNAQQSTSSTGYRDNRSRGFGFKANRQGGQG